MTYTLLILSPPTHLWELVALDSGAGWDGARPRAIGHAMDDRKTSAEVTRLTLKPDHRAVAATATVEHLLFSMGCLWQGWALGGWIRRIGETMMMVKTRRRTIQMTKAMIFKIFTSITYKIIKS